MPATRTDDELDAIYKAENGVSHASALRALYQAGRGDEAQAQAEQLDHVKTANANLQADRPKRPIANPGEDETAEPAADSTVLVGDGSDVAYSDSGPTTKPAARRPAKTNIPNTPNPGTDPPGLEHPAANSGG